MKYFISKSFDTEEEKRVNFISKLVGLPLYPNPNAFDGFVLYQTFPFIPNPNICLIFAHNFEVAKFLKENISLISEDNIFIVSCANDYLDNYNIPNKNIYLCDQNENGYALFRNGSTYNLDFNPTDTEIYLAQSKEQDILKKFKSCFKEAYINIKEWLSERL